MSEPEFISCTIPSLPEDKIIEAAAVAHDYNPANFPPPAAMMAVLQGMLVGFTQPPTGAAADPGPLPDVPLTPDHLALLTTRYWGSSGVRLTVGFPFDSTPTDLKNKIVLYMNEWSKYANISFVLTNTDPQVRISRAGDGYWSYLGTDILSIPKNQPTMNLQGFTMATLDSEFMRVVVHETGHTCGYPHEHMRSELVSRLDVAKTLAYFQRYQGWSPQVTRQQVLTPLSESSIRGTPHADQDSIMCYQLPGEITIDGQPIRGGVKIDELDGQFANKLYPKTLEPVDPKPTSPDKWRVQLVVGGGFASVEGVTKLSDV